MPLSYVTVTGSTSDTHSYAAIRMLANEVETHDEQLRVFKNSLELVSGEDFTVLPSTTQIELDTALTAPDKLLIMRQTRIDKMYVAFTNVSRFEAQDMNLYRDQILFLAQEINEEGDIFEYLEGEAPVRIVDDENYTQEHLATTDTELSYADIEMLPNDRVRNQTQLTVYRNGVALELTTDYTVNTSHVTIILVETPLDPQDIVIKRTSQLEPVTTDFKNAAPLASGVTDVMFQHILFVIEELPFFPGLEGHALRNRKAPRRISTLHYSGPGDRFHFFGLPWNPDSTVFVFVNDDLLTEDEDYTIEPFDWSIFFPVPVGADDTVTITVINRHINYNFGDALNEDITAQQDELEANNNLAYPVRAFTAQFTEEVFESGFLVLRVRFNLADLAEDITNGVIGFTSLSVALRQKGISGDPVDPPDLGTVPYHYIFITDATYNIAGVTPIEGFSNAYGPWIEMGGLEAVENVLVPDEDGNVYMVLDANLVEGFFLDYWNQVVDETAVASHRAPRLRLNGAELPFDTDVDFPGIKMYRTSFSNPLDDNLRIITNTFGDFPSQLPYAGETHWGPGLASHNKFIGFQVTATGTYTITGNVQVTNGQTSTTNALRLYEASYPSDPPDWVEGASPTAVYADVDDSTNGDGAVPFSVEFVAEAGHVGKTYFLWLFEEAAEEFDGFLTISTLERV